jgi:hypothetical protein
MRFYQPKICGSSDFKVNCGLKISYLTKPAGYEIYTGLRTYGYCEHINGLSDSTKGGKLLDSLRILRTVLFSVN